jgi:hypothetical protein
VQTPASPELSGFSSSLLGKPAFGRNPALEARSCEVPLCPERRAG